MQTNKFQLFMLENACFWMLLGISSIFSPALLWTYALGISTDKNAEVMGIFVGATALSLASFMFAATAIRHPSPLELPFLMATLFTNAFCLYGIWIRLYSFDLCSSKHSPWAILCSAQLLFSATGSFLLAICPNDNELRNAAFKNVVRRLLASAILVSFLLVPHLVLVGHFYSKPFDVIGWPLPNPLSAVLGSVLLAMFLCHYMIIISSSCKQPEFDSIIMLLARQIRSFILPVVMVVLVPIILISRHSIVPNFQEHNLLLSILAIALWCSGLTLMCVTIDAFAVEGHGTLAPFDATDTFVCCGPYAYVRNPMIAGVVMLLLGVSVAYTAWPLALWAITFFVLNTAYLIKKEEPLLELHFGESYRLYKASVPRWVPRMHPYVPQRPAAAVAR